MFKRNVIIKCSKIEDITGRSGGLSVYVSKLDLLQLVEDIHPDELLQLMSPDDIAEYLTANEGMTVVKED